MANSLDRALERFGVRLEALPLPGTVRLTRGSESEEYELVLGRHQDLGHVQDRRGKRDRPLLLIDHHVPRGPARQLIETDVQFADHSGNAYLHFGSVFIRSTGEPRRAETEPHRGSEQVANLMSTKRAQVIALVLAEPSLIEAPVRELAAASGVSTGTVVQTLGLLTDAGYLESLDGRPVDDRRSELLDLWAAAYPTGLGAKLRLLSLGGDPALPDWVDGVDIQISGEAAVEHFIEHRTLILYVPDVPPRLIARQGWRADREPHNIHLRRRFWRQTNSHSDGYPSAPWPIVYADLLESRDPRQREAALEFRQRHV